MDKNTLRKECLLKRKSLPLKYADISLFENDINFKNSKNIFCYVSYNNEIDTINLICELLKIKNVLVPYCVDLKGNMIAVQIKDISELKVGSYGILEPQKIVEFNKNQIDYVIMPGVAFSVNGGRLGYGKGYYDRFLCDISPYKIGLCHKELLFSNIPMEKNDVKANRVITF